jgi:hypothetical protein
MAAGMKKARTILGQLCVGSSRMSGMGTSVAAVGPTLGIKLNMNANKPKLKVTTNQSIITKKETKEREFLTRKQV